MASLFGHLHFWSLKKYAPFTGVDIGSNLYHDKTSGPGDEGYVEYRRKWSESRGIPWHLKNRRPEKLKDGLKDFEELLMSSPVVSIRWRTEKNLQLLLSNGTFVSCLVSLHSGDLEKIFLDKSLVGKVTEHIHCAVVTDNFIICSFVDKSKICYIHFPKRPSPDTKKMEKLSTLDPKISSVDLPGPTGRRVKRNLSVNKTQELVVCWWATASEEAWPWSPVTTEQNRSNLVILGVNGPRLDILCYIKTDSDPLDGVFSLIQPYHVLTVEQAPSATAGDFGVESCIYEYNRNNRMNSFYEQFSQIEKVIATPIPLKAPVVKLARNHAEDKLFIACDDGTLVLYDDHRKVTQITKANMTPCLIQWHPADVVVLVASAKGEIKFYDMALAPVLFQIASENPNPQHLFHIAHYFSNPYRLLAAKWSSDSPASDTGEGAPGCYDNIVLLFDRGPICILRVELGVMTQGKLGAMELVREYIGHEQSEEAVNFLNSMNWNTEGKTTFACMTIIMNHLLKQPLDPDQEGLLEETLGSFYAPSRPLSEVTVMQFRDPISRLSRRFFHHLLRYKRFEKAYLLAVDIGAKDLFMDIHYLAMDVGNKALAEVAKQRAIQIDNEASASDTGESYDDDKDSYDDVDGSYDDGDAKEEVEITDLEVQKTLMNPNEHLLDFDTTAFDDLGDEYSAWTLSDHYGQYHFDDDDDENDEEEPGSTLKIVHFGLV